MQHIDEQRLESDLQYRFGYVTEFVGFSETDIEAIHDAAEWLAPHVPALVEAVYQRLQRYECTWRHFLPRQAGYNGDVPESLEKLTSEHAQIQFRKQHLQRYFEHLVTRVYDTEMVAYLDMVGQIHTAKAGNADIEVPMIHMNALMGFVSDALFMTILEEDLPEDVLQRTLRAFNKLLWIQNDLIIRHQLGGTPPQSGTASE